MEILTLVTDTASTQIFPLNHLILKPTNSLKPKDITDGPDVAWAVL